MRDLDELILDDEGVRELGRKLLSHGAFCSLALLVETRKSDEETWTGPHLWLQRWKKEQAGYKLVSHFHTTESGQLHALLEALAAWGLIQE